MKTKLAAIGLLIAAAALCLILVFGRGRPAPVSEPPSEEAGATDTRTVKIEADNRQIVIENPEGKTLSEYLKEAGIPMSGDDILMFSSNQDITGDVAIQLLRPASVSVIVSSPENQEGVKHIVVCYTGTVADALASVGITPGGNVTVFPSPDTPLQDHMIILVTIHDSTPDDPEGETSGDDPAAGEPTFEPTPENGQDSPAATARPNATSRPSATSRPKATTKPTSMARPAGTPKVTATPKPAATPKPTATPKSTPSRVLISVETYEDCDGSGHGVKVYTYSDGTQEEVYY